MLLQEENYQQHQERQETSVTPCFYRKKAPSNIRRDRRRRKLPATSGETGDVSDTMLLQEENYQQHQERQETSVTPCFYRKKTTSNIRRDRRRQ
ncbi:hypothetical protein ACOMHN_025577 [Nucella lapillus]